MKDEATATNLPLCVDLDGTLIKTDLLWESLLYVIKKQLFVVLLLPFWWLRGRAALKHEIATRVRVDPKHLPYNEPLVDFLRQEQHSGRELLLATASHVTYAREVANHLGLFGDRVLGSDEVINLKGCVKAKMLVERYGSRKFDYVGDSIADLAVWAEAHQAIIVNGSPSLVRRVEAITGVMRVFVHPRNWFHILARTLRSHQWAKNLLVFVPLIAAHQVGDVARVLSALLAFVSFSLCASGVYIINDCLDLESDRRHPRKRTRPFASGELSIPSGLLLSAACLGASFWIATVVGWPFLIVLAVYSVLTTGYSFYLKQFVLADVIVLAQLYTIRVYAGGSATGIVPSHWLLTFSLFIFLSLALMKRFTELRLMAQADKQFLQGRGYWVTDLEHIASIGSASGMLAVLVLALYISSKEVLVLYSRPEMLWFVCPIMLYWISRAWLLAYRDRMEDDPVVFAVRDPKSYMMAGIIAVILFFAK
jgi:4-hydroxybenzoate polyprenyltransferase/phosphoserine phosphatase